MKALSGEAQPLTAALQVVEKSLQDWQCWKLLSLPTMGFLPSDGGGCRTQDLGKSLLKQWGKQGVVLLVFRVLRLSCFE